MSSPERNPRERRWRRVARLVLAIAALSVIWLGVLPALARIPSIAAHHRFLKERRINPDAMFYTELEWWDR